MDLIKRQKDYDALVEYLDGAKLTQEHRAGELHERILRILDGEEPDPRSVPQ